MIRRELYLEKLAGYKDKHIIKVITGIRRSGKSTLLELFQEELLHSGVGTEQILYINFEDMDYRKLLDYEVLYDYIKERMNDNRMYIFLDEVQMVDKFERVVDSLFLKKNLDLYIAGSNANMLSGELATLLSGRYVEIEVMPLSLKEFSLAYDSSMDLQVLYNKYLELGSFPHVLELDEDPKLILGYLEGVFNTVVLKDVVARKNIADVMMLESVIRFIFDAIGSSVSIKKISDTMTSMGRKISTHTVESYIQGLMESYIIMQVKRYDIKGKQHLKTQEKYYVADMGLRWLILGRSRVDVGHVLENIIYLELRRRGFEVYIGKVGEYEVDFIAKSPKETLYVQVAASVREDVVFEREVRPLEAIRDQYPKMILTLDRDPEMDYNGIKIRNALEFLMES